MAPLVVQNMKELWNEVVLIKNMETCYFRCPSISSLYMTSIVCEDILQEKLFRYDSLTNVSPLNQF